MSSKLFFFCSYSSLCLLLSAAVTPLSVSCSALLLLLCLLLSAAVTPLSVAQRRCCSSLSRWLPPLFLFLMPLAWDLASSTLFLMHAAPAARAHPAAHAAPPASGGGARRARAMGRKLFCGRCGPRPSRLLPGARGAACTAAGGHAVLALPPVCPASALVHAWTCRCILRSRRHGSLASRGSTA